MNQRELVERVAGRTGRYKKHVRDILVETLKELALCVASGEDFELKGYMSVTIHKRGARRRVDPNGKEHWIEQQNRIKMLPGVYLKRAAGHTVREQRKEVWE